MKYEDFDLMIKRDGDAYWAKVTHSLEGEPSIIFKNPFSDDELEQLLSLFSRPGQNPQTAEDAARVFGGRLFDAVFADDINVCLRVSLSKVGEEDCGLRIRLHLSDVPELAALPWEYLFDGFGFLARSSKTPVVRYMDLPKPNRTLTVKLPLRVLVMISSPDDYPSLEVQEEWKRLNKSLKDLIANKLVDLVLLEDATEAALRIQLRRDPPYHIFHFIGHGGYDVESGDGFLVFEQKHDEDDDESKDKKVSSSLVKGRKVAHLLSDHASLRLAILNACDGARASLTHPFGGTAQSLVRASIPAVIAMQFPITDDAALDLAAELYRAMADYLPVDAALAEARSLMSESEWGTPTLHMRSPDGCLFRKEPPPPRVDPECDPRPVNEIYFQLMVDAAREGKLVPFLGPRANLCGRAEGDDWEQTPYAPSDVELAKYLSKKTRTPESVQDLVQVSQYIELKSSAYLTRELHTILTKPFVASPLHVFLAKLPGVLRETVKSPRYPLIVTTNYDNALERAFDEANEEFDLVTYMAGGENRGMFCHKPPAGDPAPIPMSNTYDSLSLDKRTVILRIHGAVDPADSQRDSYVITEDNYIDYLTREDFFNLVPPTLGNQLLRGSLLFLGYRLRGWNLRIIFHRIWGIEGPRSESWAIEPDLDAQDHDFWNKRNVKIFNVRLQEFIREMEQRFDM